MLSDPPEPVLLNDGARVVNCAEGLDVRLEVDGWDRKLDMNPACALWETVPPRALPGGVGIEV